MSRWYAIFVSLVVVTMTMWPVGQMFSDTPSDSFPLSWYPMFHRPRSGVEKHAYVVAIDGAGEERILPGRYWDKGGMNQQREHLAGVVRRGAAAATETCEAVARKLARRPSTWAIVEIRLGVFSLERWFGEGDRTPLNWATVARCPVVRE